MRQRRLILVASCILLALVSCGKKGNPVPKGLPVPAAVTDLKGEVKDGVLMLSFSVPTKNMDGTAIKDLVGFRILKSCGGCAAGFEPWKEIRLTDKEGYTIRNGRLFTYDNDVQEGFDYGYRVYSETGKGVLGDGSNTPSLNWHEPPAPPKLTGTQEEDTKITLSWQGTAGLSYNVYRWEDAIYPLVPLNPSPLSASPYTDEHLVNGKEYKYEVRAVKVEGGVAYEGQGASVSATPRDRTPPAPPSGLKLEKRDGTVSLSWEANKEPDLAGYNVYRVTEGKATRVNTKTAGEPAVVDARPGAAPYVSYYITAVDQSGNESAPSQELTIILKE